MSEVVNIDGYELRNSIAMGNTTQIWEVVAANQPIPLAMKMVLREKMQDLENITTLKHEAKTSKLMQHPNIIQYHDSVFNKKHAYMVMEYFKAPNVKNQLRSDPNQLKLRLRKLVECLCGALGHVHDKGWVHRDIKPDNVLFSRSSEMRLIDFSLSSKAASSLSKMLGSKLKVIQGTRTYLAPETIRKQQPTPQTDMYSLGVMLYEILAGVPPFKHSSPTELLKMHVSSAPAPLVDLDPNITPEMQKFVFRMLAKKPSERHADMNEIAAEFRNTKIFKEDIEAIIEREKGKKPEDNQDLSTRLDSRTDAIRKEQGLPARQVTQKKKVVPKVLPKSEPVQPQPQLPMPGFPYPGPGQPMPGQPPLPGYFPMNPAAQYPPMMIPGMPPQVPFFPPPGMPQPMMPPGPPGMMPQGMPPQMMPQPGPYPPGQWPMQPQPGQPQPGQPQPGGVQMTPVPTQPLQPGGTPAGQPQTIPPIQPPAPPQGARPELFHPSQGKQNDDELDFMDELPDVL